MKPTRQTALLATVTAIIASLSLNCLAQDAPPPPPINAQTYTLEAKHTLNEALKYKMSMNMKMDMKTAKSDAAIPNLGDIVMNMTLRMKTVGVKPDGTGVIVTQVLDGESSAMGMKRPMTGTPPITQEVDKRGRIVSIKGLENAPGASFMQGLDFKNMGMSGVILPDHPVKVGDSWEAEQPFPLSETKGKVTCTVLGVETVQGKETLKVKQLWTVPISMSIGMDGKPTKEEANAIMSMSGNLNIGSIVNLLPANARTAKVAADVDMKMIMTMKGAAAAQSPFGESMEMTAKGKSEMVLLSAEILTPAASKSVVPTAKPAAKKPASKGK